MIPCGIFARLLYIKAMGLACDCEDCLIGNENGTG